VSQIASVKLKMEEIKAAAHASPEQWSWANHFLSLMNELATKLEKSEAEHGEFFRQFKASALSPNMLRDLRKSTGEQYVNKLITITGVLMPDLTQLTDVVQKVKDHQAVELGSTKPVKAAKAKAKGKSKPRASPEGR